MRNTVSPIIFVSLLLASACGEIGSSSPSEVVEAAYLAANEGMYSETEQYLASDVLNALSGDLGAMAGGLRGIWDEATNNGNIERLEILQEDIRRGRSHGLLPDPLQRRNDEGRR